MATMMRRHSLLVVLLAASSAAGAQAPIPSPGAGKVPPMLPAAQPRDDGAFGTEALAQMARQEADVQRQLSAYPSLRLVRGQLPVRQLATFQGALIQAFAGPGWTRPTLRGPRGRDVWTEADGWTGGKQAFAWVNLLSSHGENGLVPYTIITNMPD